MALQFNSAPNTSVDKQVDYTLVSTDDQHAVIAAREGVNHQWLQVDDVSLPNGSNTLTFYLQERVAVELGQTTTEMGHDCTCTEYQARSPCSHVYWAWDQVIRASSTRTRTNATIQNDAGAITVTRRGQHLNPLQVVYSATPARVQQMIESHTNPEVRFKATVVSVQGEAEQTFLRLSEAMYGESMLQIGGAKIYGVAKTLRKLSESASSLLDAFDAYDAWLVRHQISSARLRAAIDSAVRLYLFMMRGVVLRVGPGELRHVAAKEFDEDPHGEETGIFWVYVDKFFLHDHVRGRLRQSDRQHLRLVLEHIADPLQSREDATVMHAIERWIDE